MMFQQKNLHSVEGSTVLHQTSECTYWKKRRQGGFLFISLQVKKLRGENVALIRRGTDWLVWQRSSCSFGGKHLLVRGGLFEDIRCAIRDLKIRGRRRQTKRPCKSEFIFFQSSSRLPQVTNFVKCRRTVLKLNSLEPYPSSERERKFRRRLCTSSVHREIRHFHVVVVQWRQRNVQKSVMHVQNCCFAN